MTELHRKELRRLIDRGTMEAQHYARVHGYQVEDVIPEVIAALLSLASYTASIMQVFRQMISFSLPTSQ